MKKLVKYESWKNTKKWADSKRNINATYSMPLFISKTVAAAFFRRARAVGGDRLCLSTHGELRCTVLEYKPLKQLTVVNYVFFRDGILSNPWSIPTLKHIQLPAIWFGFDRKTWLWNGFPNEMPLPTALEQSCLNNGVVVDTIDSLEGPFSLPGTHSPLGLL